LPALLLLLTASVAFAQYQSQAWTTQNGLPSDDIRAITRTRDGYLWMTTDAGLARFDGVRFRVFNSIDTPGLLSDRYSLAALLEDKQGNLWAGTSDAGAVIYQHGTFRTLTIKDGLPNARVVRIDEGPGGRIWIFTEPGLSYWKDGRLFPVDSHPGGPSHEELTEPASHFGRDGHYWGKWRRDKSGWQRFAYGEWSPFPLPPRLHSPEELKISSIFEDSKRRLWFKLRGYPDEYYCLTEGRLKIYKGLPPTSFVSYLDSENHFWISDHSGHTALWKDGRGTVVEHLSTPKLFHTLEESDGGFWIATLGNGLFHFRPRLIEWVTHHGGPELSSTLLSSRTGTVWIGSRGLARHGQKPRRVFYPDPAELFDENLITALYEDRAGTLWVGSRNGVRRFQNGRFERDACLMKILGEVSAITEDRSGRLWFGSNRGLYSLANQRLSIYTKADGLAANSIGALLVDERNKLWIGTPGGLSCISNDHITPCIDGARQISSSITSFYQDNTHVLWVGTLNRGLARIEGGVPTYFTTTQGLPSNTVYEIVDDNEGFLWLGTRNGLVRLRKDELSEFAAHRIKYVSSVRFDQTDGLGDVNCIGLGQPGSFKADDGTLWFSTIAGVARLNPKRVPVESRPPDVLIEDVLLDQRPVLPRNDILEIKPRQANLEIRYTALSPYKPDQLRFNYQLVGLDPDWVHAGSRRVAYYSHLPPGEYDLRVMAGNIGGVWNKAGRRLHIVVPPPFYATWWFASLVSLIIAVSGRVMWHYRMGQLKRAHVAQQAFSRQLIASQEIERKRIAAELHDSLGQRLVIIKNLATIFLDSRNGHGEPDRNIEEIVSEAAEGLSEVKEISYNLRPYQLDRIGLTRAVEALIRTGVKASTITFTADIDNIDNIFPQDAQINFYRMVQEGINNILKHSKAKEASVTIFRDPQRVLLILRDDGVGFPLAHSNSDLRHGGFGLIGISERAQLLGGSAVFESQPEQGTTIRVEINLKDLLNGR
jgi:signal transduction histidine kinase/ligand-binding sensor domain-containing protein